MRKWLLYKELESKNIYLGMQKRRADDGISETNAIISRTGNFHFQSFAYPANIGSCPLPERAFGVK